MATEIEAKLKVDTHEEIVRRLDKANAQFIAEVLQTDLFFDTPEKMFAKSDRCFRLRRQQSEKEVKIYLGYKGPKEKGNFKKREEIEIEVDNADAVENLLGILGYSKSMTVEKKRRIWQLNDCEVALDKLPRLGLFVEIEGPDDKKIAEVQNKLGLAHLEHICQSYAEMVNGYETC